MNPSKLYSSVFILSIPPLPSQLFTSLYPCVCIHILHAHASAKKFIFGAMEMKQKKKISRKINGPLLLVVCEQSTTNDWSVVREKAELKDELSLSHRLY